MMLVTGEQYRNLEAARLYDLVLAEESELDFPAFGVDEAWAVGTWLRETAIERGLAVGFGVVLGEHRAFHAGTPGSAGLHDAWLERKFRVVHHYGHSTLAVRAHYLRQGESFETHSALDPFRYTAGGGAVPLRVRGALVGAVGVSGLEMHDDHALVIEALRHHLAFSAK
jgi:uncharacterized protein (UPF0303 family)